DLIMILDERDERGGRKPEGRRAAPLLLPAITLALIQKAPLQDRYEFLRPTEIVRIVSGVHSSEGDHRGVVEVVVPAGGGSVPSRRDRPPEPRVLRLIFGHEQRGAAARGSAHTSGHRGNDVFR